MYRTARLVLFVCIVSFAAACSQSSSPTSPSASNGGSLTLTADQIAGSWSLTSLQRTGETPQAKPANANYNVTFADGRVSARADCNVCSGTASISSASIAIGPALACTRAACPTMQFESAFEILLAGDSNVLVEGNTLTLTSARGRLVFTR